MCRVSTREACRLFRPHAFGTQAASAVDFENGFENRRSVKRRLRLRKRIDIERVRRHGKSFAHPLIVLIHHPNELPVTRFGVAAGRSVGGAVVRNRAKRRIRALLASMTGEIPAGSDILIIARKPIAEAQSAEIGQALQQLLSRAGLLRTA